MAYKILTKNGIDNSNIDGARGEYFNSGMRDGIVQGVLNEGLFTATASNIISLDTCELRIVGHRIVIDEPVYHTFTNTPSSDTRYAFIAQIIVDDNQNVDFSLFVQTASTPLIQDELYKNIKGSGTYQIEIGRFTLLNTFEIVDVTKTIDTITGAGGVDGDYIRIGKVTTTMLDAGLDAEVDIENVTNQTTGLKETNFNFSIPKTAGSVVNVDGQQVASVNFTSDPQMQINNLNSSKININQGTLNVGKVLIVGDDGIVIPQSLNKTATQVNVNNVFQPTLNFDSDPQVQINNILNNQNKIVATTGGGFSAGESASCSFGGGAIGNNTYAGTGGAIGYGAKTSGGFAGGYNAETYETVGGDIKRYIDAIQLGTGINSEEKTLQVYGDNIYNANTHSLIVQNASINGIDPTKLHADYDTGWFSYTKATTYTFTHNLRTTEFFTIIDMKNSAGDIYSQHLICPDGAANSYAGGICETARTSTQIWLRGAKNYAMSLSSYASSSGTSGSDWDDNDCQARVRLFKIV